MLDKLVLPFLLLPPPRSASFCPGFLPFHSLASGPESENPPKHPTFLSLFFKIKRVLLRYFGFIKPRIERGETYLLFLSQQKLTYSKLLLSEFINSI